jgi:hypothetical protein
VLARTNSTTDASSGSTEITQMPAVIEAARSSFTCSTAPEPWSVSRTRLVCVGLGLYPGPDVCLCGVVAETDGFFVEPQSGRQIQVDLESDFFAAHVTNSI